MESVDLAPFIVGASRSGTTLLRMMLDAHPDLAIPPETGFIAQLPGVWDAAADPVSATLQAIVKHPRWGDFGLDVDTLRRGTANARPKSLGDLLRRFYQAYAGRSGKRRWGDKTPSYVSHMPLIARHLPEARFVHIIRDGRDVALSLVPLWFGPSTIEEAARWWVEQVRAGRQDAETVNHLEVRYEQLVQEPDRTLEAVCAFVELPPRAEMLAYETRATTRLAELKDLRLPGRTISAAERVSNNARLAGPPSADRIGRWRVEMSRDEQRRFESIAGDLLEELGYPLGSAGMRRSGDMMPAMANECPICGFVGESFEPGGVKARPNARCPDCRSLERHRGVWLYLRDHTDLCSSRPKRMLHVAPEPPITRRLREVPSLDYLSADLDSPVAMVKMDITDIGYPDESFDVLYCSHVLQHVPDDRRAIAEFFRVLRPGGWAVIQVPIWRTVTVEDPTVTDPDERVRLFGQFDHVRSYGPDFADRLAEAGFRVTVDPFPHRIGAAHRERFGLMRREEIHFCRKVPGGSSGGVARFEIDKLGEESREPAGRVDRVRDRVVSGWTWRASSPSCRVGVRAFVDGTEVGTAVADVDRPVLRTQGIGDGQYGFEIELPEAFRAQGPHTLRVQADGDVILPPTFGYTSEDVGAEGPWYVVDFAPPGSYW